MKQYARAAYAGLAIGDALGATVEFMTPREIESQYGIHRDIIGGGWLRLEKGSVTDDTEMSLALGASILDTGKIDAHAIANAFNQWMRSKPKDIGNTVRRGIVNYRNTGIAELPVNDMDAGNGGCMRSLPIALSLMGADWYAVDEASRIQAHITHNARIADAGTECVIHMVQLAISGATKEQLENCINELITAFPDYRFVNRTISNPSGYIADTLQAVFSSFLNTSRFESCMIDVVNKGGDADTTGAITGMIAGAFYGFDSIPEIWLQSINGTVLRDCLQQAESLIELSPMYKDLS